MSASLVVRAEAEFDIAEARDWYDEQDVGLGDEFLTELESTFQRIRDRPEGYGVEHPGVRAAPLHRFPYVVFYRLIDETIQVLAVMHGRRHARKWKSRL